MTIIAKDPARAAARTGFDKMSLHGGIDGQSNAQDKLFRNPRAVREARRQLNLEFLHECAGGIAVHAALVQTFAEIGVMAGTLYSLKRLFAHARAAHPIYLELRDGADDGAEP
jgi:hypothetical protein